MTLTNQQVEQIIGRLVPAIAWMKVGNTLIEQAYTITPEQSLWPEKTAGVRRILRSAYVNRKSKLLVVRERHLRVNEDVHERLVDYSCPLSPADADFLYDYFGRLGYVSGYASREPAPTQHVDSDFEPKHCC